MNPMLYLGLGVLLGAVIGGLLGWLLKSRQPADDRLAAELRQQLAARESDLT
ncbi:MAG TPA: DNA recombination protein RmuC, partial [Verrucomicrobiales bacterium]|nr:DNA recombination protein RmuC [Verrucomicrobiales bacterium]